MHATSPCSTFVSEISTTRGSALLELLVVTPFLVGVIFATVDLSFGMKQQAAMVEAARVAARAAAILPPNTDDGTVRGTVFGAAEASLATSGIAGGSVLVEVETPPIPTTLLAVVIAFKTKLKAVFNPKLTPASGGASSAVRFVKVKVSANSDSIIPNLSKFFTRRSVVSTFPLAAGNSAVK